MEKTMLLVRLSSPDEKRLFHTACLNSGVSMASLVRAVVGLITKKQSNDLKGFDQSIAVRLVTIAKETPTPDLPGKDTDNA